MEVWTGIIAVLLGSALTGAVTIYLDRQRGGREKLEAEAKRSYEREERRYSDRLAAYAELDAVIVEKTRQRDAFEMEHQGLTPADVGFDEAEVAAFTDALVKVRLLATTRVAEAAEELGRLMPGYVYGNLSWDEFDPVWRRFRAAARAELGSESLS